jgi:23S rRNA (uracil1939-C5)-methyltransferase
MILKIDNLIYGGLSIGRHAGKVVMIKGAVLPGETVDVVTEVEKKDYIAATVREIITPSQGRIEPKCKFFGLCGGCHFQHIQYDLQIRFKEIILKESLKRIAGIEIDLSESIFEQNPWNYRFRGQFKANRGKFGFYKEGSKEVIDIDYCYLMTEKINIYFYKTKLLLKEVPVKELHITDGDPPVAFIKISTRNMSVPEINKIASELLDFEISGLFIETSDKRVLIYGQPYTTLNLGKLKYTISPMSFLQSYWILNHRVIEIIKNNLRYTNSKKILDLYAGAGNFSLPLASGVNTVAIEENQYAVEDGMRNLEINNIDNYRFIRSTAEDFHTEEKFDTVIIDPPRPGLTNKAMKKVFALMPERIIYISCNPTTFARDLKKLLRKYDIELVKMIDFFPQTYHIESLAFLKLEDILILVET